MTATSQPTLDTLPDMHNVAAILAQDARENQAGVDVISVGPVYGERTPWAECLVRQQSESRVVNNLSDTVKSQKTPTDTATSSGSRAKMPGEEKHGTSIE
jgi:hypothetical protein